MRRLGLQACGVAITGLLTVLLSAGAAAQTTYPALGRLFTSPAERVALEAQRHNPAPAGGTLPADPAMAQPTASAELPPAPLPEPVKVGGVVRRSDGRATVFVDGEAREIALGRLAPGAPLPVETDSGKVILKPGQTYDPGNGTVRDPQ